MKILLFLLLSSVIQAGIIKDDQSIFFSEEDNKIVQILTQFPTFWWTFVVVEPKRDDFLSQLNLNCQNLKQALLKKTYFVGCNLSSQTFNQTLMDFSNDISLRRTFSSSLENLKQSLSLLTLPLDSKTSEMLYSDPFQTVLEYKNLMDQKGSFKFPIRLDHYVQENKFIIPIHWNFAPTDSQTSQDFENQILQIYGLEFKVEFLGAHHSHLINR